MPHLNELLSGVVTALAQAAQAAPAANQEPGWFAFLRTMMPLALIGVFFYLVFIAPQRRKQKETQRMIDAIAKGDRVSTIGGILGTVVNVQGNEVTLKVDENSNAKIRFQKSAIAGVEKSDKNKAAADAKSDEKTDA